MNVDWRALRLSTDLSHHVDEEGHPVYAKRFDEVLKFHAPGLAAVRRDQHAWHIDPHGEAAYQCRFRRTFGFYEGRAAVISAEGWHHILPNGEVLYPQRYAWCGNFQQQRCVVRDADGGHFHIMPDGAPAYAKRWRYAGDFRDDISVVQNDQGQSTHIWPDGVFVHRHWFSDLDVYHKGYARACDARGWLHIDRTGEPLYARRFAQVEPFYNGQARVMREDGALELIDEQGCTICHLRAPQMDPFSALSADMVGFWHTHSNHFYGGQPGDI